MFRGTNDIGTFGEHLFAINLGDVVQVDIDGQTGQIEIEEIDRGTTLENQSIAKEGVFGGTQ